MKKLVLGAAATAVLAAPVALVAPSVAGASGGTSGSSVSINQYADWNFAGTQLDIGLQVRCYGSGTVNVRVDQYPPESPGLLATHGLGVQDLVCDGKTHYVTVTIVGTLFDGGKARATATVTDGAGGATTSRQITIRAT